MTYLILALASMSALCIVTSVDAKTDIWDIGALSGPPKVHPAPGLEPMGEKAMFYDTLITTPEMREKDKTSKVRTFFYEGPPYNGKPTRVFACYGCPDVPKGKKVPAMVLVHGGGGTAFESWVRLWNARGYAAIAMDNCGGIPKGDYNNWERHEHSGPAGWGGFDQLDSPVEDHWSYHAVADVVLAHSLIRSFPEVDRKRIGITGISWGGYLTCIAAGVDSRFKFAIPVYGCGYLDEGSCWQPGFESMGEKGKQWLSLWDPSHYLKNARMPMLWVTGTNDFAYYMSALQKSYRATKGSRTLCIRVNMPHAHGGAGELPEEILAFADSLCRNGVPFARITGQGGNSPIWTVQEGKVPFVRTELNFTKDAGPWPERKWETIPAPIDESGQVSTALPPGVIVYYFNLFDQRGLVVSTEHVEVETTGSQ